MATDGGKLSSLIEKATHSTSRELDSSLLNSIKAIVKSSDANVHVTVETLMENMKKNHSQVRYLALLIIDELFMRSKLFRSLLVVNFDGFLGLSTGFRRNMPLPPPASIASILRSKSIELLEKWNDSFGCHYKQIRLGYDYLKNVLRFQFPNLPETAARLRHERREREIRSKEILVNKFENLKSNYSSIKGEIRSTSDEISECFEIISGTNSKDNKFSCDSVDDENAVEESTSLAMRRIRLESLREGMIVHENSDNKAVFDMLRELYKLLTSKHLKTVQDSISVLVRVDASDVRFRDSALKELIDIRNDLQLAKKRCEELGCVAPDDDENRILWEEGKIEVESNENSNLSGEANKDMVYNSYGDESKNDASTSGKESIDEETIVAGDGFGPSSPRQQLLAKAPVMTWGSFLDSWGMVRDVPANQRGMELECHWGRVDYDAVIPAEKIAELNVQMTYYNEQHGEIRPCFAPLKKGGLCQRRDLRVCPFHGPIVPRDVEGNPIIANTSQKHDSIDIGGPSILKTSTKDSDVSFQPSDLETLTAEELAKQAVKNVRTREGKEREKDKNEKRALKRAKLAKVREHNEMVLRQSALASTSQGLGEVMGEDIEALHHTSSEYKEKKQTLASMLRKKVTPRDRLARRLLNAHATEATVRQLTHGEDSNYREAFPNQW
ncbi:UV-stimulated scaffold protein A homolog [Amborella trichopoda]|uniref:UV-stimulated scaffold protein A C-terminal domain-containing protein n=1 Tax=Amborella trichopoda TaxID=13333 RepID=W1Q0S4_AMBTC|nr:UV-stimulated scaffold protein A homolog [Amborella trichopoda]ERN14096.1 hypothetical protein AMTR_s00021p00235100 [Amborella trichopoda]|eukprot:XP_006852629.1 UV-stimulated scaffold protein A homolog [Amborella trichopoda]